MLKGHLNWLCAGETHRMGSDIYIKHRIWGTHHATTCRSDEVAPVAESELGKAWIGGVYSVALFEGGEE